MTARSVIYMDAERTGDLRPTDMETSFRTASIYGHGLLRSLLEYVLRRGRDSQYIQQTFIHVYLSPSLLLVRIRERFILNSRTGEDILDIIRG